MMTGTENNQTPNASSSSLSTNPWLDPKVIDREGFPDFKKLKPDTILEAQLALLEERQRVVETIKREPAPTFANTILALDDAMHSSQMMSAVFSWHLSNQTSDEWKAIAPKFQEQGINASSKIFTDVGLFAQMKVVYQNKDKLSEAEQRLTEDYYNGFIDSGFNLPPDQQKVFKELKTELSNLNRKFSDNITDDRKRFEWHIVDEAELKGAPKWVLESLAKSAKEKGLDGGGYLVTLEPNIIGELMQRVEVEATRKTLYRASTAIATKGDELDNSPLIVRIVQIRKQLSDMLGYPHFAAWTLRDRMVGTLDRLSQFYDEMVDSYLPKAKEEEAELVEFVRVKTGDRKLQKLERWNRAYYIRLLEEEKTGFDQEILEEYFTLERSLDVVFDVIKRLYAVTFEEAHDLERPHPDTRAFRVKRSDGTLLSYLLFDPYSRVGEKRGGAWMSTWKTPTIDSVGHPKTPGVLGVTLNEAKRGWRNPD
jgi:Zn-dependent oligopeptidase